MATASIDLPDGTKITIDGTPEEVARILHLVEESRVKQVPRTTKAPSKKRAKTSIKGLILELREQGFFKEKRSISDVKAKLESRGHIYDSGSLSPTLLRLVRDDKKLGRVKEGGQWMYNHGD